MEEKYYHGRFWYYIFFGKSKLGLELGNDDNIDVIVDTGK